MKIGILFTVNEYTVDPANLARKMEALGFESLWVPEHAVLPAHTTTPLPESPPGQGQIPEVYSHVCDPFVAMALAAGATTRLKVGTGVLLVPERNPLITANEAATLDHFSDGRLILGIGAGWLKEGSDLLGTDFPHRWTQTKEYIAAMRELWSKDEPAFDGKYVKFPPVRLYPKPARGRSADTDRQQGQACAPLGCAMGRRLVPNFLASCGSTRRAGQAAPGMHPRRQ